MKIMSKSKIIDQSSVSNIMREREILSELKNEFLINIVCSFQDFSNLYLVLKLMTGGDLRYHLNHYNKPFTEEMIKFIIINISLCLNLIHQNGIIHRDIKPENFVFDEYGYLHLTDFGLAIYKEEEYDIQTDININNNENINYIETDMVGTIGYIAPEIILGVGKYNFSVDFYALGVICYELIFMKKPYKGLTRYQIGKEILERKINYNTDLNYSDELIYLVKKLLEINPEERIGKISDINKYLKEYNWNLIQNRKYNSPFVEIIQYLRNYINNDNNIYELIDIRNCKKSIKLDNETNLRLSQIKASPDYIHYFQDYTFIYFDNEEINDIDSIFENNTEYETSNSSNSIYIVDNDLKLPPIYPRLLKNICEYKLRRYNKLLNKIDKKDKNYKDNNRHKDNNKNKDKHKDKSLHIDKNKHKKKKHKRYSHDNSSSSYDGRPIILNNFYPPNKNNNYNYNYHPYYKSPFQSIQNNFILPKINPFLKGFNEINSQIKQNIKKLNEDYEYSQYSSSETYEKLKNQKLKYDKNKEKSEINISKENNELEINKQKHNINKDKNDKKDKKDKNDKKNKNDKKEDKIKTIKVKKEKQIKKNKNKEKNKEKNNNELKDSEKSLDKISSKTKSDKQNKINKKNNKKNKKNKKKKKSEGFSKDESINNEGERKKK